MGNTELLEKVQMLKGLQSIIESAEAEAEAIKNEIKAYMVLMDVDEIRAGLFKVQYKPVTGSRFDKSEMIARFGEDCYKSFCKPTTTRRFSIV